LWTVDKDNVDLQSFGVFVLQERTFPRDFCLLVVPPYRSLRLVDYV